MVFVVAAACDEWKTIASHSERVHAELMLEPGFGALDCSQ